MSAYENTFGKSRKRYRLSQRQRFISKRTEKEKGAQQKELKERKPGLLKYKTRTMKRRVPVRGRWVSNKKR